MNERRQTTEGTECQTGGSTHHGQLLLPVWGPPDLATLGEPGADRCTGRTGHETRSPGLGFPCLHPLGLTGSLRQASGTCLVSACPAQPLLALPRGSLVCWVPGPDPLPRARPLSAVQMATVLKKHSSVRAGGVLGRSQGFRLLAT